MGCKKEKEEGLYGVCKWVAGSFRGSATRTGESSLGLPGARY